MLTRLVIGFIAAFLISGSNICAAAEWGKESIELFNKGLAADQAHDYVSAVQWLQKSSELGYPQAQIFLGLLFTKGDGLPKNAAEGTKWLRRAADEGDNAAQFYLAMQYVKGESVPQDNVLAHMWLNLAALHGQETPWRSNGSVAAFQKSAGTQRDALAEKMTPAEIAGAPGADNNIRSTDAIAPLKL